MKRSTSFAIIKDPNESKGWKPKKSKEPDVGSYEVSKSVTFIKTRNPQHSIPRS